MLGTDFAVMKERGSGLRKMYRLEADENDYSCGSGLNYQRQIKVCYCDVCGNEIYDEMHFFINNEDLCEDCASDLYRVYTED